MVTFRAKASKMFQCLYGSLEVWKVGGARRTTVESKVHLRKSTSTDLATLLLVEFGNLMVFSVNDIEAISKHWSSLPYTDLNS